MFTSPEENPMIPRDILQPGELGPILQFDAVRDELIDRRTTQAGMTQKEAADGLVWSLSKLIRIETGVVTLKPADARYMTQHYGGSPEDLTGVVDITMKAKTNGELHRKRYNSTFTDPILRFVEQENYASIGRYYGQYLLPALVQTEAYASIINQHYDHHSLLDTERLRTDRAKRILGPNGPRLDIVINESAFACSVVTTENTDAPSLMLEQFEYVKRLNTVGRALNGETIEPELNPRISVRVQPFAKTEMDEIITQGAISGLEFSDPAMEPVSYQFEPWDRDFHKYEAKFWNVFVKSFQRMAKVIPEPEETSAMLDSFQRYHRP